MNGEPLDDRMQSVTRIIVCDPRRMLRQCLASWLHSQPTLEVAATISTISELRAAEENLPKLKADVLLVTLSGAVASPERDPQFTKDRKIVAARLPNLRMIAIVDDAHADTGLLNHGFHALVNAASGTDGVLRSILAGSAEFVPHVTEQSVEDPGPLTARETEVLYLIGHGSTTEAVAAELGISVSTVASHKERIFAKLGANNQAHAVARAIELGLLKALDIRGDTSRMTLNLTAAETNFGQVAK
jgi:DNA-binding NarL/FixJ family response regulator